MHTIKIDVSDTFYDKVMLFLQNLPKNDIKLYSKESLKDKDTLTDFFKNSPLHDISINREDEIYEDKINF